MKELIDLALIFIVVLWVLVGPFWVYRADRYIREAKIRIGDLDDDVKKLRDAVRELAKSKADREEPTVAKDGPYRSFLREPSRFMPPEGGYPRHPQTKAALKGDRLNLGFYIYEGKVYMNSNVPIIGPPPRRASEAEIRMWESLS